MILSRARKRYDDHPTWLGPYLFVVLLCTINKVFANGDSYNTLLLRTAAYGNNLTYSKPLDPYSSSCQYSNSHTHPDTTTIDAAVFLRNAAGERALGAARGEVVVQRQVPTGLLPAHMVVASSADAPIAPHHQDVLSKNLNGSSGGREHTGADIPFRFSLLASSAKEDNFKKLSGGGILSNGDVYRISFRAEEDGYLYIFQVDATGATDRLFPMVEYNGILLNHGNPVQRDILYLLPSNDKAFRLNVPNGKLTIYVFASRQPHPEIEGLSVKSINTLSSGNSAIHDKAKPSLADLFQSHEVESNSPNVLQTSPQVSSSQAPQTPDVVADYLRKICSTCVQVLELRNQ